MYLFARSFRLPRWKFSVRAQGKQQQVAQMDWPNQDSRHFISRRPLLQYFWAGTGSFRVCFNIKPSKMCIPARVYYAGC